MIEEILHKAYDEEVKVRKGERNVPGSLKIGFGGLRGLVFRGMTTLLSWSYIDEHAYALSDHVVRRKGKTPPDDGKLSTVHNHRDRQPNDMFFNKAELAFVDRFLTVASEYWALPMNRKGVAKMLLLLFHKDMSYSLLTVGEYQMAYTVACATLLPEKYLPMDVGKYAVCKTTSPAHPITIGGLSDHKSSNSISVGVVDKRFATIANAVVNRFKNADGILTSVGAYEYVLNQSRGEAPLSYACVRSTVLETHYTSITEDTYTFSKYEEFHANYAIVRASLVSMHEKYRDLIKHLNIDETKYRLNEFCVTLALDGILMDPYLTVSYEGDWGRYDLKLIDHFKETVSKANPLTIHQALETNPDPFNHYEEALNICL